MAVALREAEASDEARKILVERLSAGEPQCATAPLVPAASAQERVWDAAKASVPLLLSALVLLLVVVTVARLTSDRAAKWLRRVLGAQLMVSAFGEPSDGPKSSGSFTARAREELFAAVRTQPSVSNRVGADLNADSFYIVDAFQDLAPVLDDLAKVNATLAPLMALAKVAERALGRARWTLSGQLNAPAGGRASVSASFVSGTRALDAVTYAAPQRNPAAATEPDILSLAPAVAGWALMNAATQLAPDMPTSPTPAAYGWLRAGVHAQEQGQLTAAAEHYAHALMEDPSFERAAIAHAISSASPMEPAASVRLLRAAYKKANRL